MPGGVRPGRGAHRCAPRPRSRYGDNILKNFTTSCSVILGTLISIHLFDFRPTLQFGWGSALVIGAAYLYAVGGAAAPVAAKAAAEERTPLGGGDGAESDNSV